MNHKEYYFWPDEEEKVINIGFELVGRRLEVYWPACKKWYDAQITGYNVLNNSHCIYYDRGEIKWENMNQLRVKVLRLYHYLKFCKLYDIMQ